MTRLSIIMPCFNCANTIEEAVASIYRQDLRMPFDVAMVDDGSTDSTYEVMRRLASQHTNIRLVRHQENLGGGAARNTAAAHTDGELIFCLDADDVLGDGFLRAMTEFWRRQRCDALGMSTSVKFRGTNIKDIAYVSQYEGPGRRVRFESFLEGPSCSLEVVFLMTRKGFEKVGGYPTEHGFDTQGIGFRFLCNGLSAYTCPDTVYYHRVEYHESYYLREQRDDRLNWNWFNLLDEFLYIFKPAIRDRILESDLFSVPGRPVPPRLSDLVYGRKDIYASNYRRMIAVGRDRVAARLVSRRGGFEQYWLGAYRLSKGDAAEAITHFRRSLQAGFDYRIIYFRMLQASLRLSGRSLSTAQALADLVLYCEPFPVERLPWNQRLFRRLMAIRLLRKPTLSAKTQLDRLMHRTRK